MSRFANVFAAVLFAGIAVSAQSASAQGLYGPQSYAPQRPVLSPWLQLGQTNSGPLDNYHTYVQPQLQLNETLRNQNAEIERQQIGLQDLNYQVLQPQGRAAAMMPTGQCATFMNLGHYYSSSRPTISRTPPAVPTRQLPSHSAPNVSAPNVPSF